MEVETTFICDFISIVKFYKFDFQTMYCELNNSFLSQHFTMFFDFVEHTHDHFKLCLT